MEAEHQVPVEHAGVQWVGARVDGPVERSAEGPARSVMLLAHGAGAPLTNPFLEGMAARLAARGLGVVRFNYPYAERALREGRRRPPDRRPVLEAAHSTLLAWTRERVGGERRLLLAGKSMGGRIATHLAATGADAAGLVLLGYPLHPPGRKERTRSEHFGAIAQPALFLQGTRDALCDLELLRPALETFGGKVTLEVVEGADHDFRVPRRAGQGREEVLDGLAQAVDRWEAATWP